MTTSSEPNPILRTAIAGAYNTTPPPVAMDISAEAAALYHHLTGQPLGYPADGETIVDIERYRLAALAGAIGGRLLEHWSEAGADDAEDVAEAAADALMSHARLTDEGRAILEAIIPAGAEMFLRTLGPVVAQALPHLFTERAADDR